MPLPGRRPVNAHGGTTLGCRLCTRLQIFIACPGSKFQFEFVDLGGVRVITHFPERKVITVEEESPANQGKPADLLALR